MKMIKFIVKQLRERSCVTGKQKTWVADCSDVQLYQLFLKIKNGESAKSIAQYVQKAWKVNPESTVHSISQGVLKFKKRIDDLLELGATEQAGPNLPDALADSSENLDDLMGLERLVRLQRSRVENMMKEERELGVKHQSLSRDIQSLAALSKALLKEKEYAIKHANDDPIKKRDRAFLTRQMDANFNTWMANTSDDSRERIVKCMSTFLELVKQNAIRMRWDEEKNIFVPVEKGEPLERGA